MNVPKKLRITPFGVDDALHGLTASRQRNYVLAYLTGMGAATVVEEANYFDHDFLAEHGRFYGSTSRGYPNTCRRVHIFTQVSVPQFERLFTEALGGRDDALSALQAAYLGFVVLRPLRLAPFGRTVLKWWPDNKPTTPRATPASRLYTAHLAGLPLSVSSLAWQQQDTGVSACATIALWTMLHSSAFDEHHAIPTTVEITERANLKGSLGSRAFPSNGLQYTQIVDAIHASSLAPMVIEQPRGAGPQGMTPAFFGTYLGALLRSGFPVLVAGDLDGAGGHAVTVVGFREEVAKAPPAGKVGVTDSEISLVYLHDDNIGPNSRMRVASVANTRTALFPEPPHGAPAPAPTTNYPPLLPWLFIAAVPNEIRVSPKELVLRGTALAAGIVNLFPPGVGFGLNVSVKYIRAAAYSRVELPRLLAKVPDTLAKVRRELLEDVRPASLYLGVVRLSNGQSPLIDVLYDTTEPDHAAEPFCAVAFAHIASQLAPILSATGGPKLDPLLFAY